MKFSEGKAQGKYDYININGIWQSDIHEAKIYIKWHVDIYFYM